MNKEPPPPPTPGLTVIICTHNPNEAMLIRVLDSLGAQTLPKSLWEILLIDNASSQEISLSSLKIDLPNIRIVKEPNPGLAHARKTGTLESKGPIIVFVDDDNYLDSTYLERALKIMESNPLIGVLGGFSVPHSDTPLPLWYSTYATHYAVGAQAIRSGDVTERGYVWGAAMTVRALPLRKLYSSGISSCLTGRQGKQLSSGEDAEICRWYIHLGFRLWYDETLQFSHHMQTNRLTVDYLERMLEGHHSASRILAIYSLLQSIPPKFSWKWWRKVLSHSLIGAVTFGKYANMRILEALAFLPILTFDADVKKVKPNCELLDKLKGDFSRETITSL